MPVNLQFDEIVLDWGLFTLGDATGSPELANAMIRSPGTGIMKVNITRYDPQHVWAMDYRLVTPSQGSGTNQMDYFNNIWYGGWGSAYGFRVRIETDHLVTGEVLGTSDGTIASRTWKLTKTYNRPGTTTHPYIRRIIKPVVNQNNTSTWGNLKEPDGVANRVIEQTFQVFLNGVSMGTSGWTIDNTTGILSLTATPALGVVVSWTGQYDTPMRFFTNSFQQKADFPAEIKGLQLIEIMPAELGIS